MTKTTAGPGFAQQADAFLSYARADLDTARTLVQALAEEGFDVALDVTHLMPGEDYAQRLDTLLLASAKVVFLATPDSLASDACRHELDLARRHAKPILPVLAPAVAKADLPEALREVQYLRLAAPDLVPRLAAAIRVDLDWERRHADYEHRAARGPDEVITHRREVQQAQDWLTARPQNATPVSQPVRSLIERSRQRLKRRTRLMVLALIGLLMATGGGLFQYQARLTEIRLARAETAAERARAEGEAAEARARMAELAAQSAQEQAARAEAEARETRAREAATQRLADLSRIRAAEYLMREGERDRALSELYDASERLAVDPDLDPATRDDLLISFERVLEDAFRLHQTSIGSDGALTVGPGAALSLSNRFSGVERLDAQGNRQAIGNMFGRFVYILRVIPPEETGSDDAMVLWRAQDGLVVGRGFDAPDPDNPVAFIPNQGTQAGYRDWQVTRLDDGRILIGQSRAPLRRLTSDQDPDWSEGEDLAAHLLDPVTATVTPVSLISADTFDGLAARLQGRQPYPDDTVDDYRVLELWRCAGDAPGTERYRLAQSVIADVNRRSEVGYSRLLCRWQDGAVTVATINFASSVYRHIYVYAIDGLEENGNEPYHLHDAELDAGEFDDYNIWDNVAVFRGEYSETTVVTYARREMRVWYEYETHAFPLAEPIDRVMALAEGRAAGLTSRAEGRRANDASVIQVDVSRTYSQYLADTLPPVSEDGMPAPDNRHRMSDPTCLLDEDLTPADNGNLQWRNPETGFLHGIPGRLLNRSRAICLYPEASDNHLTVVHNGDVMTYSGEQGAELDAIAIDAALSGTAPLPGAPSHTAFLRDQRSLVRVDWATGVGDHPRAYEIFRSQDQLLGVAISPDGTRAVVATSDGSPSVVMALWSLTTGRRWRDLGYAHRWYSLDFPRNDTAMSGGGQSLTPHRIPTLAESRELVRQLLQDR